MLPENNNNNYGNVDNGDIGGDGHVLRDIGHASDASLTYFDGSSGLPAPEEVQRMGSSFPGSVFTLSTWMRHREDETLDRHAKEHIVCRADDHSK